jgi:hypothetical protein
MTEADEDNRSLSSPPNTKQLQKIIDENFNGRGSQNYRDIGRSLIPALEKLSFDQGREVLVLRDSI